MVIVFSTWSNRVKGYPVNITKTCDQIQQGEAPIVNLITDTQVDVVSAPDNSFLGQALDHTQEIIPDKIDKVYADGVYHSGHNQEYCQEGDKGIDLVLTAMQGAEPRYGLSLDEQDENNLIVTDKKTGKTVQARQVKTRKNKTGEDKTGEDKTGEDKTVKKWAIKTGENKYRYFDDDSLRVSTLRQKLKKIPIEETNIRNNVEASIFQLGYHYPNDKSRYRRLAKHKRWAYSRSLWVYFIRIVKYCVKPNGQRQACLSYAVASNSLTSVKYIMQICQEPLFGQKLPQYIANLYFNMYIIVNIFIANKSNSVCPVNLHFSTFFKNYKTQIYPTNSSEYCITHRVCQHFLSLFQEMLVHRTTLQFNLRYNINW